MKRTILLVMMMLPIMAMAQLPHFAKLGEKYKLEGVPALSAQRANEIRSMMSQYKPCQ